ncbi:MAG: hypothetical protein HYV35_09345 [Lentisphaerae bacterium]|nr:hypothetical protein [Lentisphaerota bacterium]
MKQHKHLQILFASLVLTTSVFAVEMFLLMEESTTQHLGPYAYTNQTSIGTLNLHIITGDTFEIKGFVRGILQTYGPFTFTNNSQVAIGTRKYRIIRGSVAREFEDQQRAKGLIKFGERWVTPEEKARVDTSAREIENSERNAQEKLVEQNKIKADMKVFMARLKTAGIDNTYINSCSASGDKLTIVVATAWHYWPYQIRLQIAQGLWGHWANIHSPSDLDKSRILLTDITGNEVGGSRMWGGSLIWVKE